MNRLEWAFRSFENTKKFVKLLREEIIFQLVVAQEAPDDADILNWIKALVVMVGETDQPESEMPKDEPQTSLGVKQTTDSTVNPGTYAP